MNRNPSDTVMIQRGHMKNVFFVLIVVTASYLTGLMSAAFSRDVATMHVATFDGKVSIPQQSALRSHARQSETPRDQVRKDGGSSEDIEDMNKDSSREFDMDESEEWVEPKVAIFDQREQQLKDVKLDEENDSSETGSTVEDHAVEKSNGSKPSQKNNTENTKGSENGSGNNDKTNIQDISEGPGESESVLNHSKQKEKKKKKESKEKTDGISTWKMKKLTDATKIKKKISAMFNVSQDIVYFSDYDKHISRCYKNGTFQLGCKGKTPIRRYSTCAAVGGSGILIGSGCGAEIDAHDFVIRYNMPQLEKYRDDVGVKVNLSAMDNYALRFINQSLIYNPTYITSRYKQYNNSIFFYPKTIYEPKKGIKGLGSYARLKMFRKNIRAYGHVNITMAYSLRNFKNISEQFMKRIIPDFDSPTVGLMTYLLALTFCDHLDLYGFYPFMTDPQGKPIHFHYHMDQQPDKFSEGQSPHAFVNEYNFMSLLHKRGVVKATVGKCQVGTQGGATK